MERLSILIMDKIIPKMQENRLKSQGVNESASHAVLEEIQATIILLKVNLVAGIELNTVRSFDPVISFTENLPTERSSKVCVLRFVDKAVHYTKTKE